MKSLLKKAGLPLMACLSAIVILAGCSSQQQQQHGRYHPVAKQPAPAPEPAPAMKRVDYGPSHTIFEENGIKYRRGSMGFPTGLLNSSGLLLEKVVPVEVLVGQTFEHTYRVSNLTDYKIHQVTVWDRVTSNFRSDDATPKADSVKEGVATWNLGELGPKESKTIKVRGAAKEEGTITTCGWASYSPIDCEPIKVVKAALQLVKTATPEVLMCDPIAMKLTVKNTGSSALTNVRVTDQLPDGLTSSGQRSLSFDAGTLAPGQSKEFTFNATAAKTGKFVNMAKATSAQGVNAEDSATTVVKQPVLTIACEAPEERFIGRPMNICYTITNKGDGASANSVVELPVPAGLAFNGATAGGRLADNKVVWDLGNLAPGANKEVCATFVAQAAGTMNFAGTARGACAQPVSTTCHTRVVGIPAILLEVVDIEDPIEVGKDVIYEIIVTNQGSAPGTNIKVVCELEEAQRYVSGSGPTGVSAQGQRVTIAPLQSLAPKGKATWRVIVKANKAENVRFKVSMTSDQITRPVEETESTNQY